jgi:hypothetical protein
MEQYELRYSFVSTYNETIFLGIEVRNSGELVLQFSPVVNHHSMVEEDPGEDELESVNT